MKQIDKIVITNNKYYFRILILLIITFGSAVLWTITREFAFSLGFLFTLGFTLTQI